MTKAQMRAEIARLKDREAELIRHRDDVLAKLHEKTGSLETAVKNLIDRVTGHGDELSGLAASVRTALQAREKAEAAAPAPQPEVKAETVTPIKGRKAAG